LYSESADAASAASPSSATSAEIKSYEDNNRATFRHASTAQCRQTTLVRNEIELVRPKTPQTISLIMPNAFMAAPLYGGRVPFPPLQ